MAALDLPSKPIRSPLDAAEKRTRLVARLKREPAVMAPGVYDGLSSRVADAIGFDALYLSGYGVSASLLARPDAGFLSLAHMQDRVRTIAEAIDAPLIADADTGFGGAHNAAETMRAYERAGAAAIQIEDQLAPKRCGHTQGREVIETGEMTAKLRAALGARSDPNCLLIARADARTGHGLDEACRRGEAYLSAGADILFVESLESEDEFAAVGERFGGALLLANMVPGGRSPVIPQARLTELGFSLVIYPGATMGAAVRAMTEALRLGEIGLAAEDFADLHRLVGFEEIWERDAEQSDCA